ncbi:peptide-methionine (S)-S-oxide reductase MsrA [Pararhizobium mangrovi]|uniref:Peptide methionine sulfoxide reductase MsrA n=1 Tax=Pararhizobium mangrovi TaxID=2590452 RepID=A0A506TYA8_9HYPH|nr:peptide-methionine (S)-S-oxide reductase MsrA [Pararhizobium mangrovi]TPW27052.1 peptide-methionine (S)-S-oxide reductase MsrA [Pararhizobium mangrovi]
MTRLFLALAFALASVCTLPVAANAASGTAIFAGGCFWCVESDFDKVPGVTSTVSGYIGGSIQDPTYRNHPGFREAEKITFDPSKVSYKHLLDVYWHSVDPTDSGGQFCDRGHSYTTAIYATTDEELKEAKASKQQAQKELGKPIVTEVKKAPKFWKAEDYHQDYYRKNPERYEYYRSACGRNRAVEAVWGSSAYTGIAGH